MDAKKRRAVLRKFYKSKQWISVRDYVLMRDKYLCTKCDKPAEVVHHVIHLTENNVDTWEISLNPDNLVSLCAECHFNEHRGEHGKGRQAHEHDEPYPYTFDENGQIIPKPIMHGEQI
ncbi:MAG: HNH endonuclease [Lachnospiraceae bacterium]|nr:HNH endonuclease [Lachnospiraceae bacterium]